VYINAEDPAAEIVRRVHSLGTVLSTEQRSKVAERLTINPVCGVMLNICNDDHRSRIIRHAEGARLIIIDTLSRVHGHDENDNGAMASVVAMLENIAKQTGAGVLFLHHTSKVAMFNSQGDQQHAARGASSLIDNARWCGYLTKMTVAEARKMTGRVDEKSISENQANYYVRFGVSKQNYGKQVPEVWYERTYNGILKRAEFRDMNKRGSDGYNG